MFRLRNILCLLLLVLLAACNALTATTDSGAVTLASYSGHASRPPIRTDGPYLLGPGDRIRLKSYNDEQLTGEYEVNSSGYVSIPLIGQIKASGLTTSGLERAIIGRMKGKIAQDPQINIEIAAYAPFYIYGEVRKAGEYPFRPGITLADAIATAGGLTYRANETKIYLRRVGLPYEKIVTLDVPVRIFPGDNIRVAERWF